MANKYLTSESLTLIWAKIKNVFTPKHDGVEGVVANRYGVCDTASSTVEKTATITAGDFVLETGATVFIKFNNLNTAVNPTLNINNTGAKPIKRTNSSAAGSTANDSWYGGTVVPFTYDGTNWIMHHSWDENTLYVPAGLGFGYGQCSTAEATLAKAVSISGYKLVTGGTATVKFQYAVPASSTLNISSKGAKNIFYRGAAITGGVIKAGDVATFIFDGTQYHLIGLDRLEKDIGNLSTLETENKTSLVDAINEQSQQISNLENTDTALQSGIAIIVDGDTASQAVPADGYAYIKNNTHGLTDGLYKNKTSAAFPTSGGTADSTVFAAVPTGAVNDAVSVLNSNFTNIYSTPDLKDQFFGAGNVAHGSVTCYKMGHIGILKINVNFSGSASLSGKIGSVPTGYRPVAPFTFNLTSPVATDNGGYFELTSQGDVMCYISPSFTSSYYSINVPYFI